MAVGVIAPIKKGTGDSKTIYGSLLAEGYHRAPGASLIMSPKQEKDGSYRTGLDENASYILDLPREEQEIERERVKRWRQICEDYFRVDLSPNSKFYKDMFKDLKDQAYCRMYHMRPKEEMIFDLNDPEDLVIFAYLRVYEDYIAPSYDAYQLGKVSDPVKVSYYIKDEQVEAAMTYKKNQEMNKAIAALENSTISRRRAVGRSLGLGVSEATPEEVIYNLLNSYIKQGVIEEGYYKGRKSVELFNTYMSMKDETLKLYDTVKKCLDYNILRSEGGHIFKGSQSIGKSIEEVAKYLSTTEGQDMMIILTSEIETKDGIAIKKAKK